MRLSDILIIYVLVHIVFCLIVHLCVRARILKFSEQLMPIVIFVPVAGVISAIVAECLSRAKKAGSRDMTLEEMHLDNSDVRLQQLVPDEDEGVVLPLEEAMSINSAATRRMLMLDILRKSPEQYTELLHKACSDDDIEVSHYASTAVMEIQREYEFNLQKSEKAYRDDQSNAVLRNRYIDNLKKYIESGLIDENILFVYRHRFAEVLTDKMKDEPEDMEAVLCAIDNDLGLKNYTEAARLAETAVRKWPNREAVWLAKLTVCEQMNNGDGIKEVISQIKKKNVYLSKHGKSVLAFWDQSAETED